MALAFTRIEVGDPERARLLGRALASLRAPAGEDWLGRITCRPHGGGWEILLSGPRRYCVGEWETHVVSADREMFRRVVAAELQNAEVVKRLVRGLLWDRASVVLDEPRDAWRPFEDAAWDVLMRVGIHEVEVRITRWPSVWGETRYVGTLERYDRGEPEICWCGVVRNATELARALTDALITPTDVLLETPLASYRPLLVPDTAAIDLTALDLPSGG